MHVTPAPAQGDVVTGRDAAGRVLRVTAHPERGRVVLSLWQDGLCLGTLRLAPEDVPHVADLLLRAGRSTQDPPPREQGVPPVAMLG